MKKCNMDFTEAILDHVDTDLGGGTLLERWTSVFGHLLT